MSYPNTASRPAVGDVLDLPGYGRCIVRDSGDPALIALETERGGVVRVGDRALAAMLVYGAEDSINGG